MQNSPEPTHQAKEEGKFIHLSPPEVTLSSSGLPPAHDRKKKKKEKKEKGKQQSLRVQK